MHQDEGNYGRTHPMSVFTETFGSTLRNAECFFATSVRAVLISWLFSPTLRRLCGSAYPIVTSLWLKRIFPAWRRNEKARRIAMLVTIRSCNVQLRSAHGRVIPKHHADGHQLLGSQNQAGRPCNLVDVSSAIADTQRVIVSVDRCPPALSISKVTVVEDELIVDVGRAEDVSARVLGVKETLHDDDDRIPD